MELALARGYLLPAVFVLTLAVACNGSSTAQPETPAPTTAKTPTTATIPRSSPTAGAEAAAPYASFAEALAMALQREDTAWFVGQMSDRLPCLSYEDALPDCRDAPPETRPAAMQVRPWQGETAVVGDAAFLDIMTATFESVDAEALDEYGTGALRLFAVGEQELPALKLIVHFLATGIMDEPEAGRWALVFRVERKSLMPERWELRSLLQVPPDAVEGVLALGPLSDALREPDTYPEGFAVLLGDVEQALADADSEALADLLELSEYACPDPPAAIVDVPSCEGASAGDTVDAIHWNVYCTACDANGYATLDEIEGWLDRLFAGVERFTSDDLGSADFQIEAITRGPSIIMTGISDVDLLGHARPSGRWLVTFAAQEVADEWRVVELTLGAPGSSDWVLPTLLGINITWTLWPAVD